MRTGYPQKKEHKDYTILLRHNIELQKENKKLESKLRTKEKKIKLLEKLSFIDTLTGVGNIRMLNREMKERINVLTREVKPISVAVFDMDNLKKINDTKGHGEGNKIIKNFANALVQSTRVVDLVFRTGGDEFVVLIESNQEGAQKYIERARRILVEENISASVGSATFEPVDVIKISDIEKIMDDLLKEADAKMYEEKVAKKRTTSKNGKD